MIFPTIHSNGTDPEVLLKNYLDVSAACREAISLLEACAPNSRDYYVQSTEAMRAAHIEHVERLQKFIQVKIELDSLAEHVQQQVDNREEQRRSYLASRT
jgi:hypothetical protein